MFELAPRGTWSSFKF